MDRAVLSVPREAPRGVSGTELQGESREQDSDISKGGWEGQKGSRGAGLGHHQTPGASFQVRF